MRNLHLHVLNENGEASVIKLQKWQKLEKKMADFQNHKKNFYLDV